MGKVCSSLSLPVEGASSDNASPNATMPNCENELTIDVE